MKYFFNDARWQLLRLRSVSVGEWKLWSLHGMTTQRGTEVLQEKPVPVPLYQPQIPYKLTWDWTRSSVVTGPRLTDWKVTFNLIISYSLKENTSEWEAGVWCFGEQSVFTGSVFTNSRLHLARKCLTTWCYGRSFVCLQPGFKWLIDIQLRSVKCQI